MSKRVVKEVVKGVTVASSLLFGLILTATSITSQNRTAISNELGQPTFKIEGMSDVKYFTSKYSNIKDLIKDGKALVKEIEGEGIVLLENKDMNRNSETPTSTKDLALPLAKNSKVTLFGYASAHPSFGGRGSSRQRNQSDNINLKQALEAASYSVNPTVYNYYENELKGSDAYTWQEKDVPFKADPKYPKLKTIGDDKDLLESIDSYNDAAIYMITRTSGEASDIPHEERNGLGLSDYEKSILTGLKEMKAAGKVGKVIVLFNCTNQVQEADLLPYDVDASLWIGHPGDTGFAAVAEVLNGTINPSGRLSDTFWYKHSDNPVTKNIGIHKYDNYSKYLSEFQDNGDKEAFTTYVAYQEGVYLGYRYTETRYTDALNGRDTSNTFKYDDVVYRPFGWGSSYTTFELSDFTATKADHEYTVSVKVTNTGDVAGKSAAQVYVQKPYGEYEIKNHIEVPAVELVGYAKTGILAPNASETVTMKINERDFASYDVEKAGTYAINEGKYLLTAADDAHQAANNFLAFNKIGTKGNKAMVQDFDLKYDDKTYAKSEATGNEIKNLFAKSDINRYEGKGNNKLEFLSRSNWNKTLDNKLSLTDEMVAELNRQQNIKSIKKDKGAYPKYGVDSGLQLIDLLKDENGKEIAYDDPLWDKFLDQLTWQDTIDLLDNGLRKTEVSGLIGKPETKDHNGPTGVTEPYNRGNGLAVQLNDPDMKKSAPKYPSIPVLASTFNKDLAKRFGNMLGEDALWAGYNGLYGIGLNTHRSPYEGRHFEYWSEDPLLSGTMATEEVKALQAKGCNAYIKHFALNDQETQRFGIQVWTNEQALRQISLKPFQLAVSEGGAMNAMAAFSRIGLEFAPASRALMTDFLRGECGMKGLVVTDMYTLGYTQEQMPQFLMAGTDIPDGEIKHSVYNQFAKGYSEFAWQMRTAAKRVCYSTLKSNAMNGFDKNTKVYPLTPAWEQAVNTTAVTIYSIFGVSMAGLLAFLVWDNKNKFLRK